LQTKTGFSYIIIIIIIEVSVKIGVMEFGLYPALRELFAPSFHCGSAWLD